MLEFDYSKRYAKVFTSKNQFWTDKNSGFKNDITKIVEVINKHSKINFDWSHGTKTSSLRNSDLSSIIEAVSNTAQNELIKILKKYIEPHIKSLFGDRLSYKIRVSAQVKGCWNASQINKKRKSKWVDGVFREDDILPNFCFPTRGHQDLDNNGNRSSHTLIFYFQLTEAFENSSLLQFGNFEEKIGLVEFNDNSGYSNEIPQSQLDKLSWTNEGLNQGDILLFTPFTIHKSSSFSEIPRVALNVKIQPTNLDYLNLIYGYDLDAIRLKSNQDDKLIKLYELLSDASKINRILFFERAVAAFLLENFDTAISLIKEICLFDIGELKVKKMLMGSLLRKIMIKVEQEDLILFNDPRKKVVRFSCGEAIINTLN